MRAESASLGSSQDRKCPAGRPLLSLMAKDRMWIEFYGCFKRDLTLPPKYMSPIRRCARALARLSIASPFRGTPRFDIGGAKSTCTCGSTRKAQTDPLPDSPSVAPVGEVTQQKGPYRDLLGAGGVLGVGPVLGTCRYNGRGVKTPMRFFRVLAVLPPLFALSLSGDTIQLKTGERIEGTFKQATSTGAVIDV